MNELTCGTDSFADLFEGSAMSKTGEP